MSSSIVKQIAGLHRLSAAEFKDRWLQLVGSDPPRHNREFLVRRLPSQTLHPERGLIGGSPPVRLPTGRILPVATHRPPPRPRPADTPPSL